MYVKMWVLVNSEESRMIIRNEVRNVVLVRRGDLGDMFTSQDGNGNGYIVNPTYVICGY